MSELLRLERYVRAAQDDADEFCSCAETTDGFYQCPQCREWQEARLKSARERERQRRATAATDVPEEPCGF